MLWLFVTWVLRYAVHT